MAVTKTEISGLWGAHGPRGVELPGTELGQLEGVRRGVLSDFIPVSCDSLTPPDDKPCKSKDTFEACTLGQQSPFHFYSWLMLQVQL